MHITVSREMKGTLQAKLITDIPNKSSEVHGRDSLSCSLNSVSCTASSNPALDIT